MVKFQNFLNSLKNNKNSLLIESIKEGFNSCFESNNSIEDEFYKKAYDKETSKQLITKIRAGDENSKNKGTISGEPETGELIEVEIPISMIGDDVIEWLKETTSQIRVEQYIKSNIKTPIYISGVSKRDRPGLYVSDGGHRLTAAIARGDKTINALIPLDVYKILKTKNIVESIIQGSKVCFEEIKAFHGSPHAFEVFGPLENVSGTGQGANSFGYGIYFTDEKEIAQFYANQLQTIDIHDISIKGLPIYKNDAPVDYSALKSGEHVASLQEELLIHDDMFKEDIPKTELLTKVRAFFDNEIESAKSEIPNDPEYYKTRIAILEKYKPNKVDDIYINKTHNKNVYSVVLNKGKDNNYLKWELPVNQKLGLSLNLKNQKGIDVFEDSVAGQRLRSVSAGDERVTGGDLYRALATQLGSDKAASEFLLRVGIDGIDYPAGSLSGISNSKARNYVVFDPNSVTIEEKL